MFHSDNKKQFSVGVLILMAWSVVSLIYIIIDIKGNIENLSVARQVGIQEGAEAGVRQMVTQAMGMAENCEVIPMFLGDRSVELVNTACLEQAQNQTPETTPVE